MQSSMKKNHLLHILHYIQKFPQSLSKSTTFRLTFPCNLTSGLNHFIPPPLQTTPCNMPSEQNRHAPTRPLTTSTIQQENLNSARNNHDSSSVRTARGFPASHYSHFPLQTASLELHLRVLSWICTFLWLKYTVQIWANCLRKEAFDP